MKPDSDDRDPAIEYLIKEVSFSTCDNKFFGELENEMLIPNNISIYGKIKNAESLRNHVVRLEFPGETAVGYIKKPVINAVENNSRVLTYDLEELINYEDYWWFPTRGATEFSLRLNLLPPFPDLKPVGLQMACRPDVAVGLKADVNTIIRLEAKENIDQVFLRLTAPMRAMPGMFIAITHYSDDTIRDLRQTVNSPRKTFPFPHLNMRKGQALDFEVTTRIEGDPSNMLFLKCEQDILAAKLLTLSESSSAGLPCGVTVLDEQRQEIPIERTLKSTVLQATAQVMYSPFSIRREPEARREILVQTSAPTPSP